MRPVRVYRLMVIYPEGSHEKGWRPACWSDPRFLATLPRAERRALARREFRWPRERRFMSSSSAYGRANLLTWYGAEVTVEASDPVTWPSDLPASDDDRGWEHPDRAMHWTSGHLLLADALDKLRTEELRASLEEDDHAA